MQLPLDGNEVPRPAVADDQAEYMGAARAPCLDEPAFAVDVERGGCISQRQIGWKFKPRFSTWGTPVGPKVLRLYVVTTVAETNNSAHNPVFTRSRQV